MSAKYRQLNSESGSSLAAKAYIIVGPGRSGTSLTMQALSALGVSLDDDLVPPDENNLINTGEARIIRDAMVNLNVSLGRVNGFLPTDWQDCSSTQEALHQLKNYLEDQAAKAGDNGFAVKFPLASMFLPLWQRAAADAGVDLRFIWATRQAPGTIQSLITAYNSVPKIAKLRYVQRCYYILRDAPDNTLLLPYEGWHEDPAGQVTALAKVTGIEDPDRLAAAGAAFRKGLDHSHKVPNMNLPTAISVLDERLRGKRGQLDAVFERDASEHLNLMTKLADLLIKLQPVPPLGHADEENEMRLRLISKLAVTSSKESPEMNEQIDILTQRIRDVNAENRKLMQAPPLAEKTVNQEDIQRSQEVNSALVGQLTDTLAALRETQGDLQAAREQVIAVERSAAEALDEMRQQSAKLQAELAKTDRGFEALIAERDTLATQVNTQEQALDDLTRQVADGAVKLRESEEKGYTARAEFDATTANLIQESTEKDHMLEVLIGERDTLATQVNTQEQALVAAEDKVTTGKDAYARLTIARDTLEEEIEGRVRLKLQGIENREAKYRLEAQNLKTVRDRLTNQIETLKGRLASLQTGEVKSLRRQLGVFEAQLVTARKKAGKVDVQAIDIANLTRKNGALTAQLQTQHKEVAKLELKLKDTAKIDEARLSVEQEARERLQIKVDEKSKYISRIESELQDTQARILELRESTSWKVSAPVRWLGNLRS